MSSNDEEKVVVRHIRAFYEKLKTKFMPYYTVSGLRSEMGLGDNLGILEEQYGGTGQSAFRDAVDITGYRLIASTSISSSTYQLDYYMTRFADDEVTYIGGRAFSGCRSLKEVRAQNVLSLGAGAFASCSSLERAVFPHCSILEGSAFHSCAALSEVDLAACEQIGSNAFASCYALPKIVLPCCISIREGAFGYCSALSEFVLPGSSIPRLYYSSAFRDSPIYSKTGAIYVPSSLVASYKTATNWTYFSTIIKAIEDMA